MPRLPVYMNVELEPWESYGLIGIQLLRWLYRLGAEPDHYGPNYLAGPTTAPGGILLGTMDGYAKHGARLFEGPRLAITMFESTRLPAPWIAPLNRMDAVIVPSWFCADTFAQSGVQVPIHVIPLGIGDLYRYHERPKKGQGLTFLAFMDRGERKGSQTALQAFLRAFGDDERYRLVLKSRKPRIGLTFTNPNIEVIQQDMSEAELYALYCSTDVLVNPHCGEGFGLLPREFAATGGLALTTAWSGTADGLSSWGLGIPYRLGKATWRDVGNFAGTDLGEWAQVDVDELAQTLRDIAANWQTHRATLRHKAKACRRLYVWSDFAEGVLSVWQGLVKKERSIGNPERLSVA